jgi:hypothetical protein
MSAKENIRSMKRAAIFYIVFSAIMAITLLIVAVTDGRLMIQSVSRGDERWATNNVSQIAQRLRTTESDRRTTDWCAGRIESDAWFIRQDVDIIMALFVGLLGSLAMTIAIALRLLKTVRLCTETNKIAEPTSAGDSSTRATQVSEPPEK